MKSYSRFLRRRLMNLGVRRADAQEVGDWFQSQVSHRGPYGAIKVCKDFGDALLVAATGSGTMPKWVSYRKSDNWPRAWRCLKGYPLEILLRVSKCARALRLFEIDPRQLPKVLNAVLEPAGSDKFPAIVAGAWDRVFELAKLGTPNQVSNCTVPLGEVPPVGRQFRKVMSKSGPTPVTAEPPILESLLMVGNNQKALNLPYWKSAFRPLTDDSIGEHLGYLRDTQRWEDFRFTGSGQYHAAQEGAGKLRAFAAPYSIWQCLLYPIHDWIVARLRTLRTNCTWDQRSGAHWAQLQLQAGKTVWSVDLSTATCRFPLEPQLRLLDHLGLSPECIDFIQWVTRGHWEVSHSLISSGAPSTVSWQVGQPLGIAPSMSMFSLTHNLMLAGLCKELGLNPATSFRVLGDDVVLVDDRLGEAYTKLVQEAGVPISWNKSHRSQTLAEFAGYQITTACMVRPGQWRPVDSRNAIEMALELSTPLEGEVGSSWLDAQKLALFIQGEYNPPVSEWTRFLKGVNHLSEAGILDVALMQDRPMVFHVGFGLCLRGQVQSLGKPKPPFPMVDICRYDDTKVLEKIPRIPANEFVFGICSTLREKWHFPLRVMHYYFGVLALYEFGHLSPKDASLLWSEIRADLLRPLWVVPPSFTKEAKSNLARHASAMAVAA